MAQNPLRIPRRRAWNWRSLFIITDAAALGADERHKGFFRHRVGRAGLREIIVDRGDAAFLRRVEQLLAERIVLDLEIAHVGAGKLRIRMGSEDPVALSPAEDIEIAVVELLVVLVVE